MLQGYESIKELLLAKAPAAAGLLVRYIAGCRIRPHMKKRIALPGQTSISSILNRARK